MISAVTVDALEALCAQKSSACLGWKVEKKYKNIKR